MSEVSNKVIVFQLKDQQYGIRVQQVLSIEKMQMITEIPRTSDFVKGVIHLRGEIIPIIDLAERLNIGYTDFNDETRIIIVIVEDLQVGLIVDNATDVIDIDSSVIEPAPYIMENDNRSFLKGVAKLDQNLLLLLDVKRVLNNDELHAVKKLIKEV